MKRIAFAAAALALLASCKSAGKAPADPGTGPGPAAPALALSASSLSFSTPWGASPAAQAVTVSNAGGGALAAPTADVTYQSGAGWISAVSVSGSAAPYQVSVEISSAALAAGSYQATVAVSSAGASNGPLSLSVSLVVDPPPPVPLLELGGTGLAFQAEEGGAAPAAQSFTVSNAGSGALATPTVEVSYQGGSGWISAVSVSGSAAPYQVQVEVSPAGLAAGSYQATLAVSAAGAGNGPLSLPVELTVKAHRAAMSVAPRSWSRTYGYAAPGAVDPAPFVLTVTAFGEGSLAPPVATVLYETGSGWVKSVEVPGSAPPYTVTVALTRAGFAPGVYKAKVRLECPGSPNAPVDIPVQMTLDPQPSLQFQAEGVTFAGLAGGPSPAAQVVEATSASGGVLYTPVFTIDYLGGPSGWLTASGPSNRAPIPITLTPASAGLAAGTYRADVTVAMDGVLNAPQTIAVTLVLSDPSGPAMTASPTSVTFQAPQGSSPTATTVSVGQSGAGALSTPSVAVNYLRGGGWLTATLSGSAPPYMLTLTPSAATLPPGQYKANVLLVASPASNSPLVVPVVLRVMRRIQINALCTSWFHDGQKQAGACPDTTVRLDAWIDTVAGNYYPTVTWTSPGVGWYDLPGRSNVWITRSQGGLSSLLQCDTCSSVDLGSDGAGWPYPVWTGVTNRVTWELSGLSPWQPGKDQVLLHSWDAGFSDVEEPAAATGATASSVVVDFDTNRGKGLPMLRSRDDVNTLQLRSLATPSAGATYQRAVAAWSTIGIQMSYGVPATVAPPALQPPAAASSLAAEWRHSQFQAGLPPATGTLPAGHELSVVAVPAPLEAPSPFRKADGLPLLDLKRVGGAFADADYGALGYQRFPGAGWRHYRFAGYVAPVARAAPGATPVDFLAYVARYDDADAVAGPIVPLITGATSITVNGLDVMQPRSGLGTGYAYIGFTRPALGWPTGVRATLYELTNSGGKTIVSAVEEKLSLHGFYLQSGRAYVIGVQLVQGLANGDSAPWREGVPLGVSMVYSALITP